jgi:hypothetical protein
LALNLGIKIPLLLAVEVTSNAAEAAGVVVPIPICASAGTEMSSSKPQNKLRTKAFIEE